VTVPFLTDPDVTLYVGDALEVLAGLPDESVHCCVTSPPFFGLRDYGTGTWEGGDPECDHAVRNDPKVESSTLGGGNATTGHQREGFGGTCGRCGSHRIDQQIGLEATPEEWVERLVAVFREVRRVLRKDGTCWIEVGDSYTSGDRVGHGTRIGAKQGTNRASAAGLDNNRPPTPAGLKPKDLIGSPWALATALRAPYYAGAIKEERDRVWLAATLDAEGSFAGHRHVRKDDGRVRTGVHVTITNTSEALLAEAHRIWPASRISHDPREGSLGSRPAWRWVATNVDRNSLLMRELYPYLIVKRRQAMLAYNLFELSRISKRVGKTREGEESRGKRDVLVRLMSDLNHGRDVDIPSWVVEPPSVLEPGWWLRQANVWWHTNCMPESARDRPTSAHSYVFLLSKSARYFYDDVAVAEPAAWERWGAQNGAGKYADVGKGQLVSDRREELAAQGSRSLRSVWPIPTQPFPGAHFATMPEAVVRPCVLAGTSEHGCCPECGAPWAREVEMSYDAQGRTTNGPRSTEQRHETAGFEQRLVKSTATTGWRPTCEHDLAPIPATVLDPFAGSGTTALVARKHGRRSIGIELSEPYARMAAERLQQLSLLAEAVDG